MILNYLWRMGNIALLLLPIWVLVRFLWLRRQKSLPVNWYHEIGLAVFVLFLAGLANLTISSQWELYLQPQIRGEVNLIPFRTLWPMFQEMLKDGHSLINVLGNLLLFAPIGFLIPLLWPPKHPLRTGTFYTMLVSVLIELLQLFSWRSTDVDDVILNTLGGWLGSCCCFLLCKHCSRWFARFRYSSQQGENTLKEKS